MLSAWLFGEEEESIPDGTPAAASPRAPGKLPAGPSGGRASVAQAVRSRFLCVQVEHEKRVDLRRRIGAVPNLDLFVLPARGHRGEVRCVKTVRGLDALLSPHHSRPITAHVECRQRLWDLPVEPPLVYHAFMLLEVDGGEHVISLERYGDGLEMMIGEGDVMPPFARVFRATGDRRGSVAVQVRREAGRHSGLPRRTVGELQAWLRTVAVGIWRRPCYFGSHSRSFVRDLEGFLDGLTDATPPVLESFSCGGSRLPPDFDACCSSPEPLLAQGVDAPDLWSAEDVRTDHAMVLAAVRTSGEALSLAPEEFRSDRSIVLAAVTQDGQALRFAADSLKADREVVLAAASQDPSALSFAAAALRRDPEVLVAAAAGRAREEKMADGTLDYASVCQALGSSDGQGGRDPQLVATRLGDKQWQIRQAACQALASLGSEAALPHSAELAARLRDEDWTVREAACQAFWQLGAAVAAPHLAEVARCLEDDRWLVRMAACRVLGRVGALAAPCAEQLASRLADESPQVRTVACRALVRLGSAAVPAMAACLAKDCVIARQAACQALRKLGAEVAGPAASALADCLQDRHWQVRLAACEALGGLGETAAAPHAGDLAGCLADDDGDVRRAALEALKQLGGAVAPCAGLVAGLLSDDRWPVRQAACRAMGLMGCAAQPYAAMLAHLARHDVEVHAVAVEALRQLGVEA